MNEPQTTDQELLRRVESLENRVQKLVNHIDGLRSGLHERIDFVRSECLKYAKRPHPGEPT